MTVDGKPYKNHLDGYNFLPLLEGETDLGPRNSFFYWSDDGVLTAIRTGDWKVVLLNSVLKALRYGESSLMSSVFRKSFICDAILSSELMYMPITTKIGGYAKYLRVSLLHALNFKSF